MIWHTREQLEQMPLWKMTLDELLSLDRETRDRKAEEERAVRNTCKHERESTASYDMERRGDHRGHCKRCGADMSVDSGD